MCELLVRVVDKVHPDPVMNAGCTKRGDVIVICPDGWQWGKEELNNGQYMIVKLPGVPEDDVASFVSEEPETDPANPKPDRLRRLFKIDLDHPSFSGTMNHGQLMALRKRKV